MNYFLDLLETKNVYPIWLNLSKIALARSNVASKEEHIVPESLYACSSEIKIKILDGWIKRYRFSIIRDH